MSDQRPDPDQLLNRLNAEEAKARRGKLKIFFGASAGVGKTYAMLGAARQQLLQGVDVVIGIVETHGRMETEVMADGLEHLPLRDIPYRDRVLREFDLDTALIRKPALILMDELAHSNVAGSRHAKRWQDIDELLAAGIDVYSTVNVQHLESLNDVVSGITGIRVWETVPDKVFDAADEVVLVDLPPDELLQRLKSGKVYLANQAERAIRNFFRKGNLIALRELALRRTADRVDDQMLQYRRDQSVSPVWQTRDSLLACIGTSASAEKVVRTTARVASRLEAPWHAIYIETPALQRLSEANRHRILRNLKLAEEMGAQTATLSGNIAEEVAVKYARDHNLSKIFVGRDHPRPWHPWYRSFADRVGQRAPDLDVLQVARSDTEREQARSDEESVVDGIAQQWPAYAKAAFGCALAGLAATAIFPIVDLPNIVMVFLLAVVLVSVRYGRGPGVLASFLAVAIFDFFFVPPRFSFAVSDVQYLMTFFVMLVVGLITGQLTAGSKYQAKVAMRREQRVRSLYEMSRDLSAALMPEQIAEIGERFIVAELGAKAAFLLTDDNDRLQPALPSANGLPAVDMGIAQWAFDHAEPAGQGTNTLAASPILYLPLKAPMRLRGVLALEVRHTDRLLIPEQRRLLDTFASLIAIALERVHYVEVAQNTTVQMESERLRNSVLSAISHDLRTPMSVLVGLADSMFLTQPPPTGPQAEIAHSLKEEALRISGQVNNLLDMAKLQSGRVELNRQWQPLEEVVVSALKTLERAFAEHQIKVSLDENLPLVNIDSVLMERVIYNLLENTVKYTPAGSLVEVGAKVGERTIEVWVDDNGPGLPAGKEEMIFKKFERGQPEGATRGVGLGLAICRAIVEAHGGEIHAENRPQGGARFMFTLPRGNPPMLDVEEAPEDKESR
ncbi:two-component system sensor histidine kinase KdpD [Ferribacterium limneticum]|uniref:two-component system sensor histidine kinase KdpD n=1 Tax=Ferribacterium limneticum TaxID=76259 RepID=UPI001CF98FAF|nr:two-component system sensor histidine kinase KdpD [Ferribacterium limneticum]UCV28020.1 two-component system sensor histidine kinase KdpD [Ferribacterium limneticum]UCV31937.1 two-component system sensor histidine kinase KdpD [Ferribacterium limneticum]